MTAALLSSLLTIGIGGLMLRRFLHTELEQRLARLHDDIGRTVDTRVRRAVAESLREPGPGDMFRETTWKAARSGSELLSDSFGALLGRLRRQGDDESR